eukprot:3703092-Rhodomonas_salina.3
MLRDTLVLTSRIVLRQLAEAVLRYILNSYGSGEVRYQPTRLLRGARYTRCPVLTWSMLLRKVWRKAALSPSMWAVVRCGGTFRYQPRRLLCDVRY